MRIGAIDFTILLLYLAGTVWLGLRLSGKQRSAADYMVGNRDLPWWALMLSIVATETSTVTFLSVPGLSYAADGDCKFLQLPLGYCIGRLLICVVLLPQYFAGTYTTAYEVLHRRFGGRTQRLAALLFLVTRSLADGFRLFLGAVVLQTVSGLNLNLSIALFGVVTLGFTYLGGIRAVVWTDVVQFVVYIAGAAVALWVLLDRLPAGAGLAELPATKFAWCDPSFDLSKVYTLPAGLIAGTVVAIGTHGVDQLMVQRYLSARSQRDAALALATSGAVVFLQFAFFLVIGLALFAFHQAGLGGDGPRPGKDEAFARFIVQELPPGLLGVVLGAVFSAAISTLSSSINSLATSATSDIWGPMFAPHATDAQRLRATMLFTLLFGGVQIGVGIAGQGLDRATIDRVLSVQAFTVGIVLGVFLLGRYVRAARQAHAVSALAVGLAVVSFAAFGWQAVFGYALAWPWLAPVGAGTTFLTGLLASKFAR